MTQEPSDADVVTPFPARKRYEAFKESGLPIPRLAPVRTRRVPFGAQLRDRGGIVRL